MCIILFFQVVMDFKMPVLLPQINRINLWAESKMDLKQEIEEDL